MKTRCLTSVATTRRLFPASVALLVAGAVVLWAEPGLDRDHPKVKAAMAVQGAVTQPLMQLEGILGTATGVNDAGDIAIVVYVNERGRVKNEIVAGMPKNIRGVPVTVEVTEPFRAMAKGGGPKPPPPPPPVDHTAKQTGAILLGTSGGWGLDLANGYCCGGTLGALVTDGTGQYILSNYHVLEADITAGGNGTIAEENNPVIQPGLIDVDCDFTADLTVATLTGIKSLPYSNVDAALAEVLPGRVDPEGKILEVGVISSQTAPPVIRVAVKKSGRTTRLTRSSISAINGTVSVEYDTECAGGAAFTQTFTGQILVKNPGSKFLAGGDSGSLMVQDVTSKPKAVGLLFAGSNTLAVANPIEEVLDFLSDSLSLKSGRPVTVTMVGQ